MLAWPVSKTSDPMSGFFCTSKKVLARGRSQCNPIGFKINLEIMARCHSSPVVDIPITFRERIAGESKLTMKQNVEYLKQLMDLYWFLYKKVFLNIFVLLVVVVVRYKFT